MYNSFFGKSAVAPELSPRLRKSTDWGVRPTQSVMLNVPNSEKCPSSKPSTKCASSLLMFWSAWPWPLGKYQISPGPKMSVAGWPFGDITVVSTVPVMTKAHSAAMACQCSSRMAPGFRRMETPAMLCEAGNSATVASFADPASPTHPLLVPSRSNLKSGIGSCLPGSLPTLYVCCSWALTSAEVSIAVPRLASDAAPIISLRVITFFFFPFAFIPAPFSLHRHFSSRHPILRHCTQPGRHVHSQCVTGNFENKLMGIDQKLACCRGEGKQTERSV